MGLTSLLVLRCDMKLWLFLISMLLLTGTTSADIYKWVDSKGNIHFSDAKPENYKVEKKNYEVKGEPLEQEVIKDAEPENLSLQSKELQEESVDKEKSYIDSKKLEQKRYCNQLKSNIIMDESISRVYTTNKNGVKRSMTPDERKNRRQEMKDRFTKECS